MKKHNVLATMALMLFAVLLSGCAGQLVASNIQKIDREEAKGKFLELYLNTILKQEAYNRFIHQAEFVGVDVIPKKEYGATYDFIFKNNGNYNFDKNDLNTDFVSQKALYNNSGNNKYTVFRITTGVVNTYLRRSEWQPQGSIYKIKDKYALVTYGIEYAILASDTDPQHLKTLWVHTVVTTGLRGGWIGFQSYDLSKVENFTTILVSTFPEIQLTKTSYDPLTLDVFYIR